MRPELAGSPDRMRWNARYSGGFAASFSPHPLAARALALDLPGGPVLDLACGPSGSALLAAAAGRRVLAVDASDVALGLLADQARERGLADQVALVHADLRHWRPERGRYALVLCTGYWDRALFPAAAAAVAAGGLLAWEAFTTAALADRPAMPRDWCAGQAEPASLLPPGWQVLCQRDRAAGTKRQFLARNPGQAGGR